MRYDEVHPLYFIQEGNTMKKLLTIILSAVLVLALSACVYIPGDSADKAGEQKGQEVKNPVSSAQNEAEPTPPESSAASVSSEQPKPSEPKASSDIGREPESSIPVSSAATPTAKLSRDEAIAKALAKAGLQKSDVRELDRDRDGLFWEVEFEKGKTEYDYDINAETGEVFEVGKRPVEAEQRISRDEAINKALAKAGLKKSEVRELNAELDREHGGTYWEVEFESGNTEYSYDIDAATGDVIKAERERD